MSATGNKGEKMICMSRAKGQYGLTEEDLGHLECTYVRNPHYRNAPSMRLYLLADVLAAKAMRDTPEAIEAARCAAESARSAKAAVRRAAADAAIAASRRYVAAAAGLAAMPPGTQVAGVPQDVLEIVVACLVQTEPCTRFRETFAACAQDLASASLACRELRAAVLFAGWPELERAAECSTGHARDSVVQHAPTLRALARGDDDAGLKMTALRATGRALGIPPQLSTKAELAARIRRVGLGLPDGRPMGGAACPFAALAVLQERNSMAPTFDDCNVDEVLRSAGIAPLETPRRNLASAARALARCFGGADGPARYRLALDGIVLERRGLQARRMVELAERIEKRQSQAKRKEETQRDTTMIRCPCRNPISARCLVKRCGRCCDDASCSYHMSSRAQP